LDVPAYAEFSEAKQMMHEAARERKVRDAKGHSIQDIKQADIFLERITSPEYAHADYIFPILEYDDQYECTNIRKPI